MTERQKAFVLGYVMGYKEELARTMVYEIGADAYMELMANSAFEEGRHDGGFDGEVMARDLVYEDDSAFRHNAYSYNYTESLKSAMKSEGHLNPCAGPGFTQPPAYPLYLDTEMTDLCEELKNALGEAIISTNFGGEIITRDALERLYDQVDDIEQRIIMEQVDDYYGR